MPLQAARVSAAVPLFVMTIRNRQRGAQVRNGGKQIVRVLGMSFHNFPLSLGQWSGFGQNSIGNAHLANVVQQRAAAHVFPFRFGNAQAPYQLQRQFGNAAGMSFGFLVTQIERARPTFDGRIVRHAQFIVAVL